MTENSSTECTFSISDQSNGLAVISYAQSEENFSPTNENYTAVLNNQCALVKFDLGEMNTDAAITLTGMKTEATIGFDGTVTNGTTTGDIVTYGTGTTRYAVVLTDQAAVTEGTSAADIYEGTFIMPAASLNAFLDNATMTIFPKGAINGKFSVSANKKVYFSKGNLQYIGSESPAYWKFADNQWQCFGDNGQLGDSPTIDRDFFGWGTSGYNHGANCYQPWGTNIEDSDYYAYGNATYHLNDQTRQADWGYNAIRNGGNQENIGWYTLTQSEWTHVINDRYTESGYRYAKATVNDVLGIILLPDNWKAETFALNDYNTQDAAYSSNLITADEWTNILEANGAVFLPCAGFRDNFFGSIKEVNQNGYYWADECAGDEAGYAYFSTSFVSPTGSNYRDEGHSVRLVIPAE